MVEYKKHILGEATKGITAVVVGALLAFGGQKWLTSDIEYKQSSRDAYLSAPLGQQGLTMAFDGKPLKNVSVVEFTIVNRTSKQIANADLIFLVDDPDLSTKLVSAGVIPPRGISQAEAIEEEPSRDPKARKFRIKVLPKQQSSEYFHAVFVFDGEKAPAMSLSSATGDISVIPYQQWRDVISQLPLMLTLLLGMIFIQIAIPSLIDHFFQPRKHKKEVERFAEHAQDMSNKGELKSADPEALVDAAGIYASFSRPKPSRLWSKLLPAQKFEY